MLEIVLLVIGFFALVIGTITDVRTREVPDTVTYGLLATAIASRLLWYFGVGDISALHDGIVGLILGVMLGCLMYYAGQWGGADAKLLWGLGVVFGLSWNFSVQPFIVFLALMLFAGALYGLIWSVFVFIRHSEKCVPRFQTLLTSYRRENACAFLLMLLCFAMTAFGIFTVLWVVLGLVVMLTFYLWIVIKVIEQEVMIKRYPLSKLTEGDWIARDVIVGGKKIVGPGLGIEKKDISLLKRLHVPYVLVKEGIPFVPAFLIGYILTVLFGGWIIQMFL